ncbi:MAG TPA: arginine--tRNA ligase [Candidatus Paceibacterota bacterium]|nr:arginine--tRNA ligase [Candidatus Paceibacterota bacterium]
MAREIIKNLITKSLAELNLSAVDFDINHPELTFGDYSSNVAMMLARTGNQGGLAKQEDKNPKDLAEAIKNKITEQADPNIKDVQVAGPGFLNFYLSDTFFQTSLQSILAEPEAFGQTKDFADQKVMVEYTDTNPFKEFHIGHLMGNIIGETLSRLYLASGAEVKRACYQGDVGMNVAKALWGMLKLEAETPQEDASLTEKIKFLGQAYALGAKEYEEGSESAKEGIIIINKKIYKRDDPKLNKVYDLGRRWSLEQFETIYERLGTKFDYNFFESEVWPLAEKLVERGLAEGTFEKSEGAVVFHGEKYDPKLHTRVFINSKGLVTYEAKDLALAKTKHDKYPFDLSISITGHEQDAYFAVVLEVMKHVLPEIAPKVKHLSHGILVLPTGKMSSRTGKVVTAENLIDQVREKVLEKIQDRELSAEEKDDIAEKVAVGAIKYSILKQGIGKDIVFDFDKSLSFEGDSGPYLQYTYTRALSVLNKAEISKLDFKELEVQLQKLPASVVPLEHLLYRLPEVVESAYSELAPQKLVTYLIEVAGAFNSFYAQNQIIGSEHEIYFLALTRATSIVLKNGLNLLAIPVLEKM